MLGIKEDRNMPQLAKDIRATLVHGITGQEVEDCTLEEGREYTYEQQGGFDYFGHQRHAILVDGYRYRTTDDSVT